MPKIPFDDDDGRFEFAEPPELSEAAKRAMARQQKLDDANFITERTLAFQNGMAAEFARAKRDGDSADPMAVVDQLGRVFGVDGLFVADASIMPTIPRANTNIPTIMIGERFGEWLREGRI